MPFSVADAIYWIAVVCCGIAQIAILRSVLVAPSSAAASGATAPFSRRALELAWAVIPGIALAVVLAYTWAAMHQRVITIHGGFPV